MARRRAGKSWTSSTGRRQLKGRTADALPVQLRIDIDVAKVELEDLQAQVDRVFGEQSQLVS
jgi:hypothetical protein